MQGRAQFITLREGAEAKAVIAPELGGWLLRYMRHFPGLGYVDALHFSQEVVDRYPDQMYAGNPLLFPMASFNHTGGREHHYSWQGETLPLPQHGFARRLPWRVVRLEETRVALELTDGPQTRRQYPFSFVALVEYELERGRLKFRQTVQNSGSRVMPFSTGIHPYFRAPLSLRGNRKECFVELPAARKVLPHDNWASWTAEAVPAQRLSIQTDVSGTLFLTDLARSEVSLVDPGGGLKVTLDFRKAPSHRFLALWARTVDEPYYCIEPWTALPNPFSRSGSELILLPPGERFEAEMSIELARL